MEILNLIFIIISPILAVLIGQYLQNRLEKRRDKMQIFKILMTARIYGWTVDGVHALNIIDIIFVDDKEVRSAWSDLYEKYCIQNPNEVQSESIQKSYYKLLETMANSLGYKNKITWETIQTIYTPKVMVECQKQQKDMQNEQLEFIRNLNNMQNNLNT